MQCISPASPVALAEFARRVMESRVTLRLQNVNDKPMAAGIVPHSGIRLKAVENDLIIIPA